MWTVPRRLLNKVSGKHYKNKVKGQWEKDDNTIITLTLITKTFPLELNKFMFERCFSCAFVSLSQSHIMYIRGKYGAPNDDNGKRVAHL